MTNGFSLGLSNISMFSKLKQYLPLLTYYLLLFPLQLRAAPDPEVIPAPGEDTFGLEETAAAANLPRTAAGPAAVAGTLTGYLLAFVGVIFFVLMLYGGILWMIARGNEEKVKKAQELIKSSIIGVVIIFLSYVVTRFIISNLIEATGQ